MNIAKAIEDKIVSGIDLSAYQKQIDKAVVEYFNSGAFAEEVADSLSEEGIGYDLGKLIADQLKKSMKGKVKFNIG